VVTAPKSPIPPPPALASLPIPAVDPGNVVVTAKISQPRLYVDYTPIPDYIFANGARDYDDFRNEEERKERCYINYETIDIPTCKAIGRSKAHDASYRARRCYASASQRLGACLAGKELPPLDTWNNRSLYDPNPQLQPQPSKPDPIVIPIPWPWILP
jgi:hypothetical protein